MDRCRRPSLLGAAAFAAWHFWPQPEPFTTFGLHKMTDSGNIEAVAMSSDGRYVAEVKNDKGKRTLWVRNIPTSTEAEILPAFANPYVGLAFSPDGNNLYFVRRRPSRALYIRDLYQISVLRRHATTGSSTTSTVSPASRPTAHEWSISVRPLS